MIIMGYNARYHRQEKVRQSELRSSLNFGYATVKYSREERTSELAFPVEVMPESQHSSRAFSPERDESKNIHQFPAPIESKNNEQRNSSNEETTLLPVIRSLVLEPATIALHTPDLLAIVVRDGVIVRLGRRVDAEALYAFVELFLFLKSG
jgi:hypothetical protein